MYESVKKVIEKVYVYLKDLHTKSYIVPNKKWVDIERMKSKFLEFIEESTSLANYQHSKIQELTVIHGTLKMALDKLQPKVATVEELTKDDDYWVVRDNNVYILGVKELKIVLDDMKAHKAKSIMPKKN